ncbi:MAG: hypothetical protein HRT63_08620, partial [Erythrobacter sp.]|nr:hypothetical protein [Erythrobacter sp.]
RGIDFNAVATSEGRSKINRALRGRREFTQIATAIFSATGTNWTRRTRVLSGGGSGRIGIGSGHRFDRLRIEIPHTGIPAEKQQPGKHDGEQEIALIVQD